MATSAVCPPASDRVSQKNRNPNKSPLPTPLYCTPSKPSLTFGAADLRRSALLKYPMFSVSKNITSGLRSTIMSAIDFTYTEIRALGGKIFASASVIESGLPATIKEIASASARGSLALIGAKQKLSARYMDFSLSLSSEKTWSHCDYIASFQTTISEPNQTLEATPENCPFLRLSLVSGAPHL